MTRDGRVSGGVQWRVEVGWAKEESPEGGRGRAAPRAFCFPPREGGWPGPGEGKCNVHPSSPTSRAAKKSRWGGRRDLHFSQDATRTGTKQVLSWDGISFFQACTPQPPSLPGVGGMPGSGRGMIGELAWKLGTRKGMGCDREIGADPRSPSTVLTGRGRGAPGKHLDRPGSSPQALLLPGGGSDWLGKVGCSQPGAIMPVMLHAACWMHGVESPTVT